MKTSIKLLTTFLVAFGMQACGGKSSEEKFSNDEASLNGDTIMVIEGDTIRGVTQVDEPEETRKSDAYIVIDKPNLKLYVIEKNDTLFKARVCAGRNRGNKRAKDDRRTPEGNFKITDIHDASAWLYHTDDGRWVPHVYGPWFLRLDADGWQGIGIHGTNAPAQIGQRRSKGCIRMKNEDINKLHELAFVGMEVRVVADNVKGEANMPVTSPAPSPSASDNINDQKSMEKDEDAGQTIINEPEHDNLKVEPIEKESTEKIMTDSIRG